MVLDAFLLVVGMGLLLVGARGLVAGASRIATTLGLSELVVGLTVVAFGTSAPELAINVLAALRGNAAIAFGNVVGSNLANVALVVGISALIRPLIIESIIVSREIPMMLVATVAAVVLGLDRIRGAGEAYDRSDGLVLLLFFSVFLYYSIAEVLAQRKGDPLARSAATLAPTDSGTPLVASILLALGGLGLLLLGAQLTVSSAVSLAESLGVSRALVGLTVVAFGTSLPELATSVVATYKGQANLAVGNIVGSNIFNLLFILGTTATIRVVDVPMHGGADLLVVLGFSALLLPLARSQGSRIVWWEGLVLAGAYFAYLTWRIGV